MSRSGAYTRHSDDAVLPIAEQENRVLTKKGPVMHTQHIAEAHLQHPRSQAAFRRLKLLVGSYLGISMLTLVAIIVLRNNSSIVTQAVWVRGTIVLASAVITTALAAWTARGSKRAYLRLRLVSAITVVAIAVIIALPDPFPLWLKIEQSICGLLLLGVVVVVNGTHLRSVFAAQAS